MTNVSKILNKTELAVANAIRNGVACELAYEREMRSLPTIEVEYLLAEDITLEA